MIDARVERLDRQHDTGPLEYVRRLREARGQRGALLGAGPSGEVVAGLRDEHRRLQPPRHVDRRLQALEELGMARRIGERHHGLGDEAGELQASLVERGFDRVDLLGRPLPEFDAVEPGSARRTDALGKIAGLGEQPLDAGGILHGKLQTNVSGNQVR